MRQLLPTLRFRAFYAMASRPAVTRALRGNEESPPPRWPVSPVSGKRLLKRRFAFAGSDVEMPGGEIDWQADPNPQWRRELLSFRWIQDVVSVQNNKLASSFVRELLNAFVTEPKKLPPEAWLPEIAGERLAEWLYHRNFILRGGSTRFQARFVRALFEHYRFLLAEIDETEGDARLSVLKGLLSLAVYLPSLKLSATRFERAFEETIGDLVRKDGIHRSRDPSKHLRTLQHLIETAALYRQGPAEPAWLPKVIEIMGMGIRFFCHGDGRLTLMNGSLMEDAMVIGRTIERSDNGAYVPAHLSDSGFFRLERGNALILLSGRVAGRGDPSDTSFEFSDGAERFVVNCGGYLGASEAWRQAALAPAAHSTLSLDFGYAHEEPFAPFTFTPNNAALPDDSFTVDALALTARTGRYLHHQGIGGTHQREMKLSASGQQFSGIDQFRLNEKNDETLPAASACVRFHLHPDIRCQKQKDGTVLLSSVSGAEWFFTSSHPKSTYLQESVYLGYYGKPQKSLQIVICQAIASRNAEFRWAFIRQPEI